LASRFSVSFRRLCLGTAILALSFGAAVADQTPAPAPATPPPPAAVIAPDVTVPLDQLMASGPLPDIELTHIYERIIDVMRALQRNELASQPANPQPEKPIPAMRRNENKK